MVKLKYKKRDPQRKKELIEWRTNQILNAAMKVFARCGFKDTDVEEIATLAGVGKGTVYRYFKSKDNLFLSVVEWGLNTLKKNIVNSTAKTKSGLENLKMALSTYLGFFERNREFFRVLIEEGVRARFMAERQWRERHLAFVRLLGGVFEDIITQGMKEGVFKKIDAGSAGYALWGMSNAIMFKWLMSEKRYPIKKESSIIEEICFSGILASPKK